MISFLKLIYLLGAEIALFAVFFNSERLRKWSDVACFAFIGLFIHALLMQYGNLNLDEWSVLSATVFTLSFAVMGWGLTRSEESTASSLMFGDSTRDEQAKDEHLIRSNAAFHEDRLRTIGENSARFIHQLNHPVSTLLLRVQELRRAKNNIDAESFQKSIASLERQLNYIIQMTSAVKTFAAQQDHTQNGFVKIDSIFELSRDLCEAWSSNQNLTIQWPKNLPQIEVPGGLTVQTQVLVNLLKNAIDAVTESTDNNQRWIKLEVNERGGAVEFSVSNGGPALSKRSQLSLFKPFFTTKKIGQGLGLGLALSRDLVESVGGEIWYDERSRHPRFVVRYSFLPSVSESTETKQDLDESQQRFFKVA